MKLVDVGKFKPRNFNNINYEAASLIHTRPPLTLFPCNTTISQLPPLAMSFPKRAPSKALLSSLRPRSNPHPQCLRTLQARFESTEKKTPDANTPNVPHGKSFRAQLYESTQTRLQREREEREKFKDTSDSPGSRNIATSVGRYPR